MKKKLLMMLFLGCMLYTACGINNEADFEEKIPEETNDGEMDGETEAVEEDTTPITDKTIEGEGIEYFVFLGEYIGLNLIKASYEVTDEDMDIFIQADLAYRPLEITDPEATVAMGDMVNISYEGKTDGELFEGGSADSYNLIIGSGSFIDDFEEQLVGVKVGDTKEVNVTFPEDFHEEEMQGKDAVFIVNINSIWQILEEPTEEWVTANTSYNTVDGYIQGVRTYLDELTTQISESNQWYEAWAEVLSTARFNAYPQNILDECLERKKEYYEYYAAMNGMEYDEYLEACDITEDDILTSAKVAVQEALVVEYICSKEEIREDSEVYQNTLKEMLAESGFESVDEGRAAGISESVMKYAVKYNCVKDLILDHAVINEKTAETEK